MPTRAPSSFAVTLPNEQATRRLAVELADILRPGDVVTLSGDLGVGKTTFARALIRHLAGDERLEVPSPTFTLMQTYDLDAGTVVHVDLYRVTDASELAEIGFGEADDGAITLIEWPERADDRLPSDRLDVSLSLAPQTGADSRRVHITGFGAMAARAARTMALREVIERAGFAGAARELVQGDASTRRYERLIGDRRRAILMDSPRRADGPSVKNGLPYSAIAHLAEDVKPFVALARGLKERGFSAPDIYAADLEHGVVVIEDLGTETFVSGEPPRPIAERYAAAVDALIALHRQNLPETLPVDGDLTYRLPHYDQDALLIEAELFCEWYAPHRGMPLSDTVRHQFTVLWREALVPAIAAAPTWVLRDVHSPNLLWLPQRSGVARVGLLDFQDAVMGPPAYDLASLLQDARVDVEESLELELLTRYTRARRAAQPDFDAAAFIELYAVLGAQRATKILGIFARLDQRDRKPQYLRHLPRVWRYLRRSLAHPVLSDLATWYDVNALPP